MSEEFASHVVQLDIKSRDLTCAFSPDRKRAVTGVVGNVVRLWDTETGDELATLRGHSGNVYSVEFSPDGTLLASGSLDGTARLWAIS